MASKFPKPAGDALPARTDPGIADSAILGKCALAAHGSDTNAGFVAFKYQLISGTDTEDPSYFKGDSNLSLAGDFGLFLHFELIFLTLPQTPYPGIQQRGSLRLVV
jgi:hypothetical protein